MDLNALLKPKSIAVVGASEKGGMGKATCVNLLRAPVAAHTYFVNPKQTEILGKKCYGSLAELPEKIELVVLSVNKKLAPQILREAAAIGCKAAVVYASGYSETGSAEDCRAEQELVTLCAELELTVMGVNCAGFINKIDEVYAFGMIVKGEARKGSIGIISQSGKICLNAMQLEGMNYSYLISSGNGSMIPLEEYLDYLIDDVDTRVVGLYLEGIKNTRKFVEVLKKAVLKRKPIVVLKIGRSEKGSALAASHTGSLSGADQVYDAVFKKFNVIRVDDIEELFQTCYVLSILPKLPEQGRVAALSLSGGETGVCADVGSSYGLDFPEFAAETKESLRGILPDYATINNPLDLTNTLAHDGEKYAAAIKAVMNDPKVGMVLTSFSILPKHKTSDVIYSMSEGMVKAAESGLKPLAVMSFINCSRDKLVREKLEAAGIPILPATGYGFKILKYIKEFVEYDAEQRELALAIPLSGRNGKRIALSEHQSKQELAAFGIAVPKERLIKSKEMLTETVKEFGYPVVLKVESAAILHKSDVGGVKLNLRAEQQLFTAYEEILRNVKKNAPQAAVNGVLMQSMLPKGREFIIGIKNDPQFGPVVLCGLGGVLVEIFKDISLYPAPLNHHEAEKMIQALKGYKLLAGYRGEQKCDIEALADLMVKVSRYAVLKKDEILELDLNPVFVYSEGKGVGIADALIIKDALSTI